MEKHNFWEICYVEDGEIMLSLENNSLKLLKHSITFIPPDTTHSYYSKKGNKSRVFVICFECLSVPMKSLGGTSFVLNDRLQSCMEEIIYEWECENIANMEAYLEKLSKIAKDKKVMLGIYLWDYSEKNNKPMNSHLFEKQLCRYFNLLKDNKIEGVIFCSSTIGDADLETNKILKRYIAQYGDTEIEDIL